EKDISSDQRNAQQYARTLDERVAVVARDEKRLVAERDRLNADHEKALAALAELDVAEARKEVLRRLEESVRRESSSELRRVEKRAKADADLRGREILVEAMQRQAAVTSSQNSVSWVELPSEEM